MFTIALFIMTQTSKLPVCPSIGEWVRTLKSLGINKSEELFKAKIWNT